MRCGKERGLIRLARNPQDMSARSTGEDNRGKTLNTMANKNLNLPTLVRQCQRHKPDAPISVVTCCDKQRNGVGKQIVKKRLCLVIMQALNRLKIWRLLGLLSRTNKKHRKIRQIFQHLQQKPKFVQNSSFFAFPRLSSHILAYPLSSLILLAYPPRLSSLILAHPRSSLLILGCPRSAAAKIHDLGLFSLRNR